MTRSLRSSRATHGVAPTVIASIILASSLIPALSATSSPTTNATGANSSNSGANSAEPKIFAHRGGEKWAPENSMAAFAKCVETGVYGIELDIHQCKSGELVVIHDDTLERTTDGSGFIKDKDWSQLKGLDSGSWYSPEFKEERLPQLLDVLAAVNGQCVVNIEIKNTPVDYPGIEDTLITLLKTYKYPDKIVISSFDHGVLQKIHKKAPQYKLAFLADSLFADIGNYARSFGAASWNPDYNGLRADAVADAHKEHLEVNTWTVDDRADWQKAMNMGADGIITNDPVGLAAFLKERKTASHQ